MRVQVDRTKCEGYGICTATAPHLFRHDDDGVLILTYDNAEVPADDVADAEYAASCCPAQALSLAKEQSSK